MPPIIGIDLGTTNSLVAYVDYRTGLPRVIPDRREQVLVPSIVSFTSEGPVVGDEARRLLAQEPGSTVFSAKRLLGRTYDDAAPELADLPFTVLPGEVGRLRNGRDDHSPSGQRRDRPSGRRVGDELSQAPLPGVLPLCADHPVCCRAAIRGRLRREPLPCPLLALEARRLPFIENNAGGLLI